MTMAKEKAGRIPLLTSEEMRRADAATSEKIGIPSLVLMERAALSMREEIEKRFPPCSVAILCGTGNNGADGLALARLLCDAGYEVHPLLMEEEGKAGSSFARQKGILDALGITVKVYEHGDVSGLAPKIAVDALFGTRQKSMVSSSLPVTYPPASPPTRERCWEWPCGQISP